MITNITGNPVMIVGHQAGLTDTSLSEPLVTNTHTPKEGKRLDTATSMDSREISLTHPLPGRVILEKPEVCAVTGNKKRTGTLNTLKSYFQKKSAALLNKIKRLAHTIANTFQHPAQGVKSHPENTHQQLPQTCDELLRIDKPLLHSVLEPLPFEPKKCRDTEESIMTEADPGPSNQTGIRTGTPPEVPDHDSEIEEEEDEFYDALDTVESDATSLQSTSRQQHEQTPSTPPVEPSVEQEDDIILDAMTGLPLKDLREKAWNALSVAGHYLTPVGKAAKGVAGTFIAEDRLNKLENALSAVLKDRVQYEVNENRGRRMAQLMSVAGATSPMIPAMMGLSRIKDFKGELSAVYYDRDIKPLATDLAMTFGPAAITLLLGIAA